MMVRTLTNGIFRAVATTSLVMPLGPAAWIAARTRSLSSDVNSVSGVAWRRVGRTSHAARPWPPMTDDEAAELELLLLASARGKFAISVGGPQAQRR
jgi:hypothetical protein